MGPISQTQIRKGRGNNGNLSGIKAMPQKFGSSTCSMSALYLNRSSSKSPNTKEKTFDGTNNDQSGYILRKKMSSIKPYAGELTFRSYNPNDVRSSLQKCRSGGCTVPLKVRL